MTELREDADRRKLAELESLTRQLSHDVSSLVARLNVLELEINNQARNLKSHVHRRMDNK